MRQSLLWSVSLKTPEFSCLYSTVCYLWPVTSTALSLKEIFLLAQVWACCDGLCLSDRIETGFVWLSLEWLSLGTAAGLWVCGLSILTWGTGTSGRTWWWHGCEVSSGSSWHPGQCSSGNCGDHSSKSEVGEQPRVKMIHLSCVPRAESPAHRMCIVPSSAHTPRMSQVTSDQCGLDMAQGCAAPEPELRAVGNASAFPSLGCFSLAFIRRDWEVVQRRLGHRYKS